MHIVKIRTILFQYIAKSNYQWCDVGLEEFNGFDLTTEFYCTFVAINNWNCVIYHGCKSKCLERKPFINKECQLIYSL